MFSTANRGKICVPQIASRLELIPWHRLKRYANFPQAPQEEASLSNKYVGGTLSLLSQVEWTQRCPISKEGQISLQWLEYWLAFHLTR